MAGRSSRSFREEGRLEDIAAHLRPGDFLLVQFAHNDANRERPERYVAPEDFAASLRPYLDAARAHGATCVFASAMAMRVFDGQGVCWPSFPAYRQEMARFAAETNTPYLDLGAASAAACTALGAERCKTLYLWHDEVKDDAHLQQAGAQRFARVFAGALHRSTDPRLAVLQANFPKEEP